MLNYVSLFVFFSLFFFYGNNKNGLDWIGLDLAMFVNYYVILNDSTLANTVTNDDNFVLAKQ